MVSGPIICMTIDNKNLGEDVNALIFFLLLMLKNKFVKLFLTADNPSYLCKNTVF